MAAVAVISDTHLMTLDKGFCRRIEQIADEVDQFFHLGDAVNPQVLDFLNAWRLDAVAGNMDPAVIVHGYPRKRIVRLGNKRIGLMHGWGPPDGLSERIKAQFDDVDCICHGHSHRPTLTEIGGVMIFNPGSICGGRGYPPTWGRLTVTDSGLTAEHIPF